MNPVGELDTDEPVGQAMWALVGDGIRLASSKFAYDLEYQARNGGCTADVGVFLNKREYFVGLCDSRVKTREKLARTCQAAMDMFDLPCVMKLVEPGKAGKLSADENHVVELLVGFAAHARVLTDTIRTMPGQSGTPEQTAPK